MSASIEKAVGNAHASAARRLEQKRPYNGPEILRLGNVEELTHGNGVLNADSLGTPGTFYGNPNKP